MVVVYMQQQRSCQKWLCLVVQQPLWIMVFNHYHMGKMHSWGCCKMVCIVWLGDVIWEYKRDFLNSRWVTDGLYIHTNYICIEFLNSFMKRNKSITYKANELLVCGQVGRMQVVIYLHEKFQLREKLFLLVDTFFILSTLFCLKNIH